MTTAVGRALHALAGDPGLNGAAMRGALALPRTLAQATPARRHARPAYPQLARDNAVGRVEAPRHRLDPATPRPPPQPRPGADSAERYFSLLDALVSRRL